MKKSLRKFLLFYALFSIEAVWAGSTSVSFDSNSIVSNSTMILNLSTQSFHPPIEIQNINDSGAQPNIDLDLGDASDGTFDVSRYSVFSEGADVTGNVITINTDDYPELNVTSFILNSGWTIRPTGSNPLVIRSHGDVIINGDIDCSGEPGEDVNPSHTDLSSGGTGVCGGTDGGDGGTNSQAASDGVDFDTDVTGGKAATGVGTDSSGGGGGSYGDEANDATDGVGASFGAAGDTKYDNRLLVNGAGTGGGGGSSGTDSTSGAGGGAGGGFVFIVSGGDITLSASGSINADGGDGGGQGAGTYDAGAGGAGGGGTIALFALGDLTISGPATAYGGTGGTTNSTSGGDGSEGRTWATDIDGAFVPVNLKPDSLLGSFGDVEYKTGNFSIDFLSFDSESSFPTITSATLQSTVPGGSSVNLLLYTSDSSDENPDSEFVNAASILNARSDRYIYSRINVSSVDGSNPVIISAIDFDWDNYTQEEFKFVSSCGSIKGSGLGGGSNIYLMFLPLLFLLWLKFTNHTSDKIMHSAQRRF